MYMYGEMHVMPVDASSNIIQDSFNITSARILIHLSFVRLDCGRLLGWDSFYSQGRNAT